MQQARPSAAVCMHTRNAKSLKGDCMIRFVNEWNGGTMVAYFKRTANGPEAKKSTQDMT